MSRLLVPLSIAALFLGPIGCSTASDHRASLGVGDAGAVMAPPNQNACDTPNQDCACADDDQIVECGQVERVSGDYVSCSTGHRTCTDGEWSACIGDSITTQQLSTGKQRTQGLGTGMDCAAANPCDPFCRFQVDDGTNLPLPDGGPLAADGNGIRLVPHDSVGGGGAGSCTSMVVKPTPQTTTVTSLSTAAGGPGGLLGEYFKQIDTSAGQISTTWVPTGTRQDPNVDFDWGNSGPNIVGLTGDNFSVRWTGSIVAPATNAFTLCAKTDDGVRLWVDGVLRIDDWVNKGADDQCAAPLSWNANSVHSVRLEYFQGGGLASAALRWSSSTIPLQAIPPSAFAPPGTGSAPVLSNTPQFQIELSPAGCFPGTPQPAWTLDRLDLAAIDDTGKVSLISGVAGPIAVSAYLGQLSASGTLNVKVDIAKNDLAPTGSVTAFQGTAAGADNSAVLYPYDQTVMPLGLQPPQVQWDNKGTAGSAIKLSLVYPATGAPSFRWSEIIPESNPPRAAIPSNVWAYFSQTAKANAAGLVLQRIVGGQLKLPSATRIINFSSAPVRGKIYYTQYHRGGDANEMVVDPGSDAPAQNAFATTDGCPVCHTVSANGNVFATSSRYGLENNDYGSPITFSATLGGVSSINTNGGLTPIADFVANPPRPNYTAGSVDWRGFAWAPLTPDGKYALVATNVWGNTQEALVGINGSNRQVNTGNTMLSGGSGTGLLAEYFATTDATFASLVWKRIDPQVSFDFGATSPGGLVPVDFSVRRSGRIQAFFSQTYHFEVVTTSSDVFSLTVGATSVGPFTGPGTLTADVPLIAGAFADFSLKQQNTAGNSNVQLYWSSPSTPRALVPQTQLYPPAAEPVHGASVTYNDGVAASVTRIEPDIASNWQAHAPAIGLAADNWTSTWDTQIESPYTGPVQLCLDSDDGVKLYLDGAGTALINSASSYNNCVSAPTSWVFGAKHALHIVHTDNTGDAHLILKYKYGALATSEVVPTVNLYPGPIAAVTNGLTATYYDLDGFNAALPASQTDPRAFQRIDPNIDFDWDTGRPNYSIISDDDHFSVRWTGKLTMACNGVYRFQSNGNIDDGGRLWIDDSRVMGRWGYGALSGAGSFTAGDHDFKFDFHDDGGSAVSRLQWNTPCAGSPGWVTIPSSAFTPNATYDRTTGYIVDGGDNGDNSSYWVWQLPTAASPTPVDVTASSVGRWGLSGTAMMVPSFSPDGSKLVFIDGDSAGGAGWRKGLSTFDFDQTGKLFKNRRLVTSTWPLGDAIKWPSFESDSRSVIYQTTVPGDSCCRTSSWTKYGYMGPTNYYEDPGRLWSVDTRAATPTPVALTKLNSGEQAKDANKSYQPTMLPVASGGYRWVVFTSTRPYGNTLNLPNVQQDFSNTASYATSSYTGMTNTSDIQSQLWVGAIDDSASGASDRSHPGFWLPSQNFSSTAASGYINERGYWVLDACHPTGSTAASSCEVDEDCCGGTDATKSSACRLDTPVSNPPLRHCRALPAAGMCVAAGGQCGTPADCCTDLACVNAVCSVPPAVTVFGPANYERIYMADCADGTKPVWRFFDWKAITPDTNSKLEFYAETQADPTLFATLPIYPNPVTASDVVLLGSASGPTKADWVGASVSERLDVSKMLKSQLYVKITIRFVPNTELTKSPVLQNWRQSYSCEPAE